MERVPATAPEQLIYDEAQRAIGRQQAAASELRSGAWLALVAFLVVTVSALAVIWPASRVPDGPSIEALVRSLTRHKLAKKPDRATDLVLLLTSNLADHQRLVARRIAVVAFVFRAGAIALLIQLMATVAARILTT